MEELTNIGDLLSERQNIDGEIKSRLNANLIRLIEAYVIAFGEVKGMEIFSECLTREAAQTHFPGGWTGFAMHIKKISG